MQRIETSQPSVFAQMVDGLRNKSEEELKLLYLRFFASDLANEWKAITSDTNLENVSEEDIIRAIRKNRYKQ